ncbi:hypothetical protein AMJ40_03475 [candidate division TA06 bacterium DG_26]|uniref:DUF2279 domain-containing protein n=1 Tax=candidate division TA06 bacterium DG_26 TaxID=1703771 RepID=A0A0S7WJD9_UNCT6|nr:MAG: hypothetical protein AMJ40_03475 [candidate division TA06 bacterium DG_26]
MRIELFCTPMKKSICLLLLFSATLLAEETKEGTFSEEEKPRRKTVQILTAATIITGGGIFLTTEDVREYVKDRWEQLMSPMHGHASNKGAFRFRTNDEEGKQSTHCDKGCHFIGSYFAIRPLAYGFQWMLNDVPPWLGGTGRAEKGVSRRAIILSAILTSMGGFYEEFVDGYEKDEGFSLHDHIANECGVVVGVLKLLGYLDRLDVYWTYESPRFDYQWPLWTYMEGYTFKVQVDLTDIFFGERIPRDSDFDRWVQVTGFLPQINTEPTRLPPF